MSRRRSRQPVVLYQPRDEGVRMPLGLLAVASALPDEHVVLIDGRLDLAPESRVVELAANAACLAVTVRTGRPLRDALSVSRAARKANPRLPILWGGPHATLLPSQCLATGDVDGCVVGAGEDTVGSCLAAFRSGQAIGGIAGVAVPGKASVQAQPPPSPSRVGPAQYGLLDLARYFRIRGGRRLDYSSSRGRKARDGSFWTLPSDRVVAEVSELADRHDLEAVLFQEEDFFADATRVQALARGFVDEGRRVTWEVGARPEDVLSTGADGLRLLRESGCGRIHVLITPGGALMGESREKLLETGSLLSAAKVAGRFVFYVDAPRKDYDGLRAADSVARALTGINARFETPLERRRIYPPEEHGALAPPSDLEGWVDREQAPWPNPHAERRLRRRLFFLTEAQRPPGRLLGKRVVHLLARARVKAGFFSFDIERLVVETSTLFRTGKRWRAPRVD